MRTLSHTALALAVSLSLGVTMASAAEQQAEDQAPSMAGSSTFYKEKAEGWFWYKEPPADPPEEKPKKPEPVAVATAPEKPTAPEAKPVEKQGPPALSVAWIKANLPKFRDRAIDNPTDKNVRAYYYLQRVMLDKSSKFSEASSRVIMRDPFLDEDSRRPVATYAANALNREAGQKRDNVVHDLAKNVGLFFFFKSNCVLCDEQAGVLQALTVKSGMTVIPVSLDGGPLGNGLYPDYRIDQGQAKQLKVYQAPAIAMAIPPSKTEIVGYGAVTMDVLQNRLLMVAQEENLIDKKTYQSTQPFFDNGLLSQEDVAGMEEEQIQDPDDFVQHMQDVLAKKTLEGDLK